MVSPFLEFFNSSDEFTAPNAASFDKQIPLPWKMLVELRSKIDHSTSEEEWKFKPVTPIRCQLVSPVIAQRTMSLATNGKSTSSKP